MVIVRNLKNKDLFKIMRLVRKTNFQQKLTEIEVPKDEQGNILESEYGMLILSELVDVAPDVEKEIFEFLSDIAEVDPEQMENDEFELLPKVIKHLKEQEKFNAFLKQAFDTMN